MENRGRGGGRGRGQGRGRNQNEQSVGRGGGSGGGGRGGWGGNSGGPRGGGRGNPWTGAGDRGSSASSSTGRGRGGNGGGDARSTTSGRGATCAESATAQIRYQEPAVEVAAAQPLHSNARSCEQEASLVSAEVGRGAVRGRRVLHEVIRSRPVNRDSKCGSAGRKVVLKTNFFRVNKTPSWSIGQYHVDFSPDVDVTRIRRAYLSQHRELLGGYIYNGSVLYTCTNLRERMTNEVLELTTVNRAGEQIILKIKYVGNVSPHETEMLHLLNLILRQSMEKLDLQQVQRNFFDPKAKINLNAAHLEIWPGYETSIRQHETDVLLCVDMAHKVIRTETIYAMFCAISKQSRDFQAFFQKTVVGSIVITDYNNKTYRVIDVAYDKNPKSKFKTKTGEISFADYYKARYNIQIRDVNQPLLIAESTDKRLRTNDADTILLLIPELCRPTGITDEMRRDFRIMKAISDETRMRPDLRITRLISFNSRLKQSAQSSSHLKNWQMHIDERLVEVPGRVLDPERILFGNKKMYLCDKTADWTREFRNNQMYAQTNIVKWIVVLPDKMMQDATNFIDLLIKAAGGMRMTIKDPKYISMANDRSDSYNRYLEEAASQDPQIIMAIMPTQNEEKYSCIKKKLCIDRPVPSQVMCGRTIRAGRDGGRGLMSVATKVVIQMNAKLLGSPWLIEMPLSGVMFVGFDICHSVRDKTKSYGALVATMDLKSSSRYFSHVSQHVKGQELSNEISLSMSLALDAYQKTHSCLPQKILFYRDGVGDGQLGQVYRTEVQVLKNKINSFYEKVGQKAKFAFVVVSKRINTRFFINNDNPPPGTIVDDVITLPERYDFYLVSQSVRQGTVSPTSYNVIYDTMGLPPNNMQILTYKMTHLYYNWSGTTRVPAVCQYAHKLAFLVGQSLFRAPSASLQGNLFFL